MAVHPEMRAQQAALRDERGWRHREWLRERRWAIALPVLIHFLIVVLWLQNDTAQVDRSGSNFALAHLVEQAGDWYALSGLFLLLVQGAGWLLFVSVCALTLDRMLYLAPERSWLMIVDPTMLKQEMITGRLKDAWTVLIIVNLCIMLTWGFIVSIFNKNEILHYITIYTNPYYYSNFIFIILSVYLLSTISVLPLKRWQLWLAATLLPALIQWGLMDGSDQVVFWLLRKTLLRPGSLMFDLCRLAAILLVVLLLFWLLTLLRRWALRCDWTRLLRDDGSDKAEAGV